MADALISAASAVRLSPDEIRRYSRHITIPEIGMTGQQRIKRSRVLCIGAGGLGSPALMYLAAAGVGTLGIIDADVVDESNLQRQVIHGTSDVGRPKVDSAADRIAEINPTVDVIRYQEMLDEHNALELFDAYDLIIDGTDNFSTRYLVNDAAVLTGKPYVWGSIYRLTGQASVFWPGHGPCYRCLHPQPPSPGAVPSCAEGGVLGAICATVASIQVAEALKLLTGVGQALIGRLLIYEALDMNHHYIAFSRNPNCAICGDSPTITELSGIDLTCTAPVPTPGSDATVTCSELHARQQANDDFILIDVREPAEFDMSCIPGAVLIPKGDLTGATGIVQQLPTDKEIILYCQTGIRSAQALAILQTAGLHNIKHLDGGITAWAETVDSAAKAT